MHVFFYHEKKKYIYIHVHVTSGACVKKIPNLSQCEYFKYTCSVYNYTEFARLINNMRVRRSWYTGHHYLSSPGVRGSRGTGWCPSHSTKCPSRDFYRNWSSLELLKAIPSIGSRVSYILSHTTGYHRGQTVNNRRRTCTLWCSTRNITRTFLIFLSFINDRHAWLFEI